MQMTDRREQKHQTVEAPKSELALFLLEIRPHVIGIMRAINRVCGLHQKAKCPQCQHQFNVD
jgi:hypothetical protein